MAQTWLHLTRQISSEDGSRQWTRELLLNLADIVALEKQDPLVVYVRGWPDPIEVEEDFATVSRTLAEFGCWIL